MPLNLGNSFVTASLWYPTILGVLVVISAIVLFIGSIYLLLGTNLGARLGFLVTFTCLTGFMLVLSTLWLTTASPLESPKGRIAVVERRRERARHHQGADRGGAQHRDEGEQGRGNRRCPTCSRRSTPHSSPRWGPPRCR